MENLVLEKIDKIAEDVSYLRGKYDATIPALTEKVNDHEKRISGQDQKISNIQGKATIVGAIGGGIFGGFITWLTSQFH